MEIGQGTGPAEPDPPLEGFVESKLASLKSLGAQKPLRILAAKAFDLNPYRILICP